MKEIQFVKQNMLFEKNFEIAIVRERIYSLETNHSNKGSDNKNISNL